MKKLKLILKMFWIFFKIGAFTFGGGLAMLPLIHKEIVVKEKLVSDQDMLDIFAISQSVPGVIAINTSIFVGKRAGGMSGACAAALGVILPAVISIILIIALLSGFSDNIYVQKAFAGIRSASAALILLAAFTLGKSAVKENFGIIVAVISFAVIIIFDIHAAWVIALGGMAGAVMYFLRRGK